MRLRNSMVLKYANRDKALSREIFSEIPLRY